MSTTGGSSPFEDVVVFPAWFGRRAALTPDRTALIFEGTASTYAEVWAAVEQMTATLAAHGVAAGSRVAYLGANSPVVYVTWLAANRLGAAFVPVNNRWTAAELEWALVHAGVVVAVAEAEHRPVLDELRDRLPELRAVLAAEDDPGSHAPASPPLLQLPQLHQDDDALFLYTSGTTARPKAAVLTHANLWWGAMNTAASLELGTDEVTMVLGPMFHISGLCSTSLPTWIRGGTVVCQPRFVAGDVLRAVARHRVTSIGAVTSLLLLLAEEPGFDTEDLSSLRSIYTGGAPMSEAMMERYAARGVAVQMAYGATETAPSMAIVPREDAVTKRRSVGKPVMFMDVVLKDGEAVVTEPRRRGEVWVRGPAVFSRYWHDVEATRACQTEDGWFRTGDVAEWDEDGFLYLVDRLKDMIKSGGESIAPAELEAELALHPSVREVAVVGAPDARWGETPVAVVVPEPGTTVDLEELRSFASARLARYKLPTRLVVVDELPRSSTGKVLRYRVAEALRTAEARSEEGS